MLVNCKGYRQSLGIKVDGPLIIIKKKYMKRTDPFLALPDYRENLVCELLMGHPNSGVLIPDTSEKSNDGTKTAQVTRVQGLKNKVLDFSVAGSKVTIPADSSLNLAGTPAFTYLFWLYYDDYTLDIRDLLRKDTVGPNSFAFSPTAFDVGGTNFGFLFNAYDDNGGIEQDDTLFTDDLFSLDEWFMLSVILDFSTRELKVYKNLELVITHTLYAGYNWVESSPITVGAVDGQLEGKIDLMRIYDENLSLAKIKQIFENTRRYNLGISPKL